MIRFSSIWFFCSASSTNYSDMFTLILSKMIGQDTIVKDFELRFLLLKESYFFGGKFW